MRNTLKILVLPIALVAMLSSFASGASAQSAQPLDVRFVPDPLFDMPDFLPGDETSGQVTVTNDSGSTQTILTEAINISDDDDLGALLRLRISGDGGVVFDDTLARFFADDAELPLATLPNGRSAVFTFTVSFMDSDDNSYQGKSLGFDICVGFQGGNSRCGGTVVGEEGGGAGPNVGGSGGGGTAFGMGGGTSLVIFNEQARDISNIAQSGSATITWDTNFLSTSQVVYGPVSGGPYALDLDAPNFGYPFGTAEDGAKVRYHSVLVAGLVPGQAYAYRVVSRASPPTISYEHQFTVPVLAQAGSINFAGGGDAGSGIGDAPGTSSATALGSASSTGESGAGSNASLLAGAAASGFGWIFSSWVFWIILILLLAIYLILRALFKKDR